MMRKIALVLSVCVLSLGVGQPATANEILDNLMGATLVLGALIGGMALIGGFDLSSNDLAGFRSEDDPDTGRFFVSPHIDAGTDAGITFGYQLRF